ncbi:putative E3 ubiquitin ligase [Abeliophyllum distichum]|uniref:E3 ubiquitin ligase n=1 Tax=Abeliophyllum distichum TaxID=126358 RepID=A0ABD1QLN5_9LAMI
MASSQVEFASSSPFGCALRRDHNRWNWCTATPFKNNLNDLVSSCISDENSNPRRHIDYTDLWVHQPQWQITTIGITATPDNDIIIRNNNDDISPSTPMTNHYIARIV